MKKINFQNYVNLVSALIVFIGGLMIIFMYPGGLSSASRLLIGLIVTLYFAFRMTQTIMSIRRERRQSEGDLKGITQGGKDGYEGPKSP
jgi:hypothetical protein